MAAPEYVPRAAVRGARVYESPPWEHEPWLGHGKADLTKGQPRGTGYGNHGPDQGYALIIAERFRDQLALRPGEDVEDALQGGVLIGLKRASLYGRAPVIHDIAIALTIWGLLDSNAPDELVARRRQLFEGVREVRHHTELQHLVDQVPEDTLRKTRQEIEAAYPAQWQALLGLTSG